MNFCLCRMWDDFVNLVMSHGIFLDDAKESCRG